MDHDIDFKRELEEYGNLLTQIGQLQEQADRMKARLQERAAQAVRAIMRDTGLSVADLDNPKPSKKASVKLPPKYRDPATNREWSGVGRRPHWLGDNPEQYRIGGAA